MPEQQAESAWRAQTFAVARAQRPRVVVKADLLPAVSVVSFVGLLGIPLGLLWAVLAPPQRERVVRAGAEPVPLQLESWHRFDDLAIFLLIGLATGILVGVAVWLLRERRGPVVLIAAALGSLLSAWLAMRLGLAFAESRYAIDSPPALGDVVERAPRLESAWALVAQPFTTVLAYGFLATWNSRDDLGRRLG
ncbi:DUF2567 domain-containing protein [Prauserella oleivorans]|uniref:DUF2567 domain-containing protein n=1 Tax=Prauserella oleivorans TaxID=1478153 RepID=A0ABW5W865_9PSEU